MIPTAFASGLLFGFGLLLAGMANPAKVQAFLDLAGAWDPSLMLVMGGAIAVAAPAFAWAKRHQRTLLGASLELPQARHLDRRLLLGAALFGAGWGMAGICPGPALVLLAQGKALIFVLAMLAGMGLHAFVNGKR
ncbi:MAG: YeeE/YedE family protein [Rhodocyclaceae bacterium]|nr:YeeE/YedE family protein [Rhodocyclaceae bacterium]